MRLFLGIDAGQTSSKCALGDERGTVLSTGSGGPVTHLRDLKSRQDSKHSLREAVLAALKKAELPGNTSLEAIFLGSSGIASMGDAGAREMTQILKGIVRAKIRAVDHDAQVALAGAIPSCVGVIAIAGTGSLAFGRNSKGATIRAGGWGYLIGDSGSAFEIGRRALAAVARAHDGMGSPTTLTRDILTALSIEDPAGIKSRIYLDPNPRIQIAAIAPWVAQCARSGDPIAGEIMRTAGQEAGKMVCAVARKLDLNQEAFPFAATGGVTRTGELWLTPFREEVLAHFPSAMPMIPRFLPHFGAYLMALRTAGIVISEGLLGGLEESIRDHPDPLEG
ncbi:MAG: BadF/BadG/BcrA/BcrD ATPase family protein [Terriglobia bacterium]